MLQGMFGQKLAQHFSLPTSSSLVLHPRPNAQIVMTRMTMPKGFPGPTRYIPPEKPIRYRSICAAPRASRVGERGWRGAFIVFRNGMPVEFRYLIWSRSRSRCGRRASIQFISGEMACICPMTRWCLLARLRLGSHQRVDASRRLRSIGDTVTRCLTNTTLATPRMLFFQRIESTHFYK
jgi:hypothetical protein